MENPLYLTLNKLPEYVKQNDRIYGVKPGTLTDDTTLKIGDYILIKGVGKDIDGVYKVTNLGSESEHWNIVKAYVWEGGLFD